jgi:hypothetical protein
MGDARVIFMSVYYDAVKLEKKDLGRRVIIGWFRDEVSAISAAVEHILIHSALLSSLRKLPELVICTEYKDEWIKRPILNFKRATRVKVNQFGRRVVRVPGTFGKVWI